MPPGDSLSTESSPKLESVGWRPLCHWGPLIALGIVKIVTWMTMFCNSMWWPPWTSFGSTLNTGGFLSFALCTLYYFLSALTTGPGYVPLKWAPKNEEDQKYLQFCLICEGYKPPRAHHCRKCGRCVKKMDHHCPWINGCVGWANHLDFTLFLFFAVLGCIHAAIILAISLNYGINRTWYIHFGTGREPAIQFTLLTFATTVLALGLAIGVVFSVGMLLYFQLKSILKNRTAIEEWIEDKANYRLIDSPNEEKFLFPYHLGWKKNFKEVFVWNRPLGDGIVWNVREGCHQYTLTIEQLKQKAEKRTRSRVYEIERSVRGGWCPLSAGFNTVFRPPCTDEPRIRLELGDQVIVTRWRKYWLFGEKVSRSSVQPENVKDRIRGWFPRNAAVEINVFYDEDQNEDKKDQ